MNKDKPYKTTSAPILASVICTCLTYQGWSNQQFLVELSRAKVARSLIWWSQGDPKSSSFILLKPSLAQKIKFDIDQAEP
jgi:hypothetical protein